MVRGRGVKPKLPAVQGEQTYTQSRGDIDSARAMVAEQAEATGVITLDDFDTGKKLSMRDDLPPNFPTELMSAKSGRMEPITPVRISKMEPDKHPLSNYITLVNRDMAPKVPDRFFDDSGICFMGDLYVAAISTKVLQAFKAEEKALMRAKVQGTIDDTHVDHEFVPAMGRTVPGEVKSGITSFTRNGAIDRRGLTAKLSGE